MSEIFGSTTEVRVEAPPPPPPPPPAPSYPGPTPEELDLYKAQRGLLEENLAIARRQQALQEQQLAREEATRGRIDVAVGGIENYIAEQARQAAELAGLSRQQIERELSLTNQVYQQAQDARKAYIDATGMTPEAAQALEGKQQLDVSQQLYGRYQKALRGELPVSPGLERSLGEQRETLVNSLLGSLGPGYMLSTPGQRALAEFDKRAEELRDQARTGAIGEAEQYAYALTPATQRAAQAYGGALGTGAATRGIVSPSAGLVLPTQYFAPSMPQYVGTPPQLDPLLASFGAERANQYGGALVPYNTAVQSGNMGYRGMLDYTNMLNQGRFGVAGARAQAQGNLLASLIGAGGMVAGAAALPSGSGAVIPRSGYPYGL